ELQLRKPVFLFEGCVLEPVTGVDVREFSVPWVAWQRPRYDVNAVSAQVRDSIHGDIIAALASPLSSLLDAGVLCSRNGNASVLVLQWVECFRRKVSSTIPVRLRHRHSAVNDLLIGDRLGTVVRGWHKRLFTPAFCCLNVPRSPKNQFVV